MDNKSVISAFYKAFAGGDAEMMVNLYADGIIFTDPVFGTLHGEDAKNMWRMLIERSKGDLKIMFSDVEADGNRGSARWTAGYTFSQTGRKVTNHIHAVFEFENGKITKHTDHFNLWKWSRQALGFKGYLFGWTPFMKSKIRQQTSTLLKLYNRKRG